MYLQKQWHTEITVIFYIHQQNHCKYAVNINYMPQLYCVLADTWMKMSGDSNKEISGSAQTNDHYILLLDTVCLSAHKCIQALCL